ncbi:DUF4169 family protein [Paracoccus aminovorans]|uniref:DUF4169 family protein n=1 Tax=Paracoccus aminovorans TaxID=34004 RepID=UPI000785A4E2|nr:DUF4169 family protein [Paracoccus aminovorans]
MVAGPDTGSGKGKVVNLRAARKSAARDAARRQGDENAAKFGRSKAAKQAEAADLARAARHLDQHHLDQDRREEGDADA